LCLCAFVAKKKLKNMKFAVIEGLDGSGKSTQVKMLQEYLKEKKISFEYLHFPSTDVDSPIYGDLVARFLRGEFGANDSVNPYLVALIYAGDRHNAANLINSWLSTKKLVIVDRYVLSNIAYQCAKLDKQDDKEKLKQWILNLEYNYYKIPKPDINIFFDVPFDFTVERLTKGRMGNDRDYLQGSNDIHEADMEFQSRVRDMYLQLAKTESTLKLISCSDNNGMMPPGEIFKLLINCIKNENIF
jgi:dTMP kinase